MLHWCSNPGLACLPAVAANPVFEPWCGQALGPTGRFGSYSAPQITSVAESKATAAAAAASGKAVTPTRFVEVSFNALTQSGFEVPRKGVIAALQPTGSSDVLMLVSSAGMYYMACASAWTSPVPPPSRAGM